MSRSVFGLGSSANLPCSDVSPLAGPDPSLGLVGSAEYLADTLSAIRHCVEWVGVASRVWKKLAAEIDDFLLCEVLLKVGLAQGSTLRDELDVAMSQESYSEGEFTGLLMQACIDASLIVDTFRGVTGFPERFFPRSVEGVSCLRRYTGEERSSVCSVPVGQMTATDGIISLSEREALELSRLARTAPLA